MNERWSIADIPLVYSGNMLATVHKVAGTILDESRKPELLLDQQKNIQDNKWI